MAYRRRRRSRVIRGRRRVRARPGRGVRRLRIGYRM